MVIMYFVSLVSTKKFLDCEVVSFKDIDGFGEESYNIIKTD